MARHDEKTSTGRAKMLSRGDTGDRLAEVNKVLAGMVRVWVARKTCDPIVTHRPYLSALETKGL